MSIVNIDLQMIPLLVIPVLGYAEIHYRFPFLPSLIFRREPEIVFDVPIRAEPGRTVPLFLFIKDAHRFPVFLNELEIRITAEHISFEKSIREPLNRSVEEKFWWKVFELPRDIFPQPGDYRVEAMLRYTNRQGRAVVVFQDNYRGIPHRSFQVRISEHNLPALPGWHWGDLHLHSNFTDDQVEFGAPIGETAQAAQTIGLDFIAVTDHSYDLDDREDNFLQSDPQLTKWTAFQKEVREAQQKLGDFIIIPGEEVSVGNHCNRNVHCLVLNDPGFHYGSGDSAEKLRHNRPTQSIPALMRKLSGQALAIAAHPVETPPLSQRIILNRGEWDETDCQHDNLNTLQILNDDDPGMLEKGVRLWKKLLLRGKKVGIVAGNDAHGNFNCFRQVQIPFLKLIRNRQHLLGKVRTAVKTDSPGAEGILHAIRNHRCVISNGPFAEITLQNRRVAHIGETCEIKGNFSISVTVKSIPEYGSWQKVRLLFGDYTSGSEQPVPVQIPGNSLEFSTEVSPPEIRRGYVRLEAFTRFANREYFCFTNPIWINQKD